jgi:flavin-dependent dehydrogenase
VKIALFLGSGPAGSCAAYVMKGCDFVGGRGRVGLIDRKAPLVI